MIPNESDVTAVVRKVCKLLNSKIDPINISKIIQNNILPMFPKVVAFPSYILLAGLPGSGKNTFCIDNFFNKTHFIIDPDYYRRFHPDYKSLSPENLIIKTNEIAYVITMSILEIAIIRRINFVLLSSITETKEISLLLSKKRGDLKIYNGIIMILGEPLSVCYKSMQMRYEYESKDSDIIPRLPDFIFLNKCVKLFPSSLIRLFNEIKIDKIMLYLRYSICNKYTLFDVEMDKIPEAWELITKI